MRIPKNEEFRLLEVFKANAMDVRYWSNNLGEFDNLRANGLVSNGYGLSYGTITLTQKGLHYIQKIICRIEQAIS